MIQNTGDMEETQLFSYDSLLNYVKGNTAFADRILMLIIEELPKDILIIEEAMECREWQRVALIVHKIKPNIQMCSKHRFLFDLILNLEKDCRENTQLDTIPARIKELKAHSQQLVAAIKESIISKIT